MRNLPIALVAAVLALAGCPKDGTAPSNTALDRNSHEPKFPIAAGKHATVDCNSCHGEFDTFMATTADDVQRVARAYFRPENRTILTILPTQAKQ